MKKIIFAMDPKQAAAEFTRQNESVRPNDVNMTIIPRALSSNEKFWAELVKVNPEFIGRVPEAILNSEAFSGLVDHNLFYEYLPKKYLSKEDYEYHKENSGYAITGLGYAQRAAVTCHDENVWYRFDHSSHWIAASKLSARDIFNQFDELTKASELMPELWTQELADTVWNSSLAIVSFNAIPPEYVRPEWCEIVEIFNEKRYPLFGRGSTLAHPECLAEYWSKFETKEELEKAFQVEKFVERCANPYGYAVNISFGTEVESDTSDEFKNLYTAVKPLVEQDHELMESFIKLYDGEFMKQVPDEIFDINWILRSRQFKFAKNEYLDNLEELELAATEVERLEAEELLSESWESLKKLINRAAMSDDEIKQLIGVD